MIHAIQIDFFSRFELIYTIMRSKHIIEHHSALMIDKLQSTEVNVLESLLVSNLAPHRQVLQTPQKRGIGMFPLPLIAYKKLE